MRFIRLVRRITRAIRIAGRTKEEFEAVVCSCAKVSKNNNEIAYIIRRVGAFGGPKVEIIDRPEEVELMECDNFVVVKDGKVYELTIEEI